MSLFKRIGSPVLVGQAHAMQWAANTAKHWDCQQSSRPGVSRQAEGIAVGSGAFTPSGA